MNIFSHANPDLYKHCHEKYNISSGCNTIRIGTLFGFRAEENQLLRDEGEGKFYYSIRFPRLTPVSPEWLSEFGSSGGGAVHIIEMQHKGKETLLTGLDFDASEANGWIFCTSTNPKSAGNITVAHQSKWIIREHHIDGFGRYLASLLYENLKLEDLPDHLIKGESVNELSRNLSIELEIRQISYEERQLNIQNEDDFPLEEVRRLRKRIPFIKPKRFADEREVRFAFWLNYRGKRVSINDNTKILSLRPIDGLIEPYMDEI